MNEEKTLIAKIERWAKDRNLIDGSTPQAQFVKLLEEVGELAGNLSRGRLEDAVDDIGDCLVVLTIIARQIGSDLDTCAHTAYNDIKDRKGRMIDGVFIKEEDLPDATGVNHLIANKCSTNGYIPPLEADGTVKMVVGMTGGGINKEAGDIVYIKEIDDYGLLIAKDDYAYTSRQLYYPEDYDVAIGGGYNAHNEGSDG